MTGRHFHTLGKTLAGKANFAIFAVVSRRGESGVRPLVRAPSPRSAEARRCDGKRQSTGVHAATIG
jgi:hypothetical protein